MTRAQLIEAMIESMPHLSIQSIENAVKQLFETMVSTIERGERIEIRGFGSFSLHYRSARSARNPKTGEIVTTTNKYVPHFKPGKELRERVNTESVQ